MKRRARAVATLTERRTLHLVAYMAAHRLAHLSELAVLTGSRASQLESEMLASARELVRLLEGKLSPAARRGRNVIDLRRELRLRAIGAALRDPDPNSRPPLRAA